MKILLISPHFYPENFKCNDAAFELAKRGHEVTVLSDIPNYPLGKFFNGYGLTKKRKEIVRGVKIIRVLVVPRGKGGGLRLVLNYLSFAFFASLRVLLLAYTCRYNAILVHETSPITVGIPAVILKKIQKIPLYFWVLDLWPESLSAAGGVQNRFVLNCFTEITKWIYRNSHKILISSLGFRDSILQKGNFVEKLVYFPNWADVDILLQQNFDLPVLPNGFIVMFAGNIGEAQDFNHIMDAAVRLKNNENIHFVIVGDGRKRTWIEQFIQDFSLQNTVHMMGQYPLNMMNSFFQRADVMLVSLKDSLIFKLTVPAKIQAYMAASRPIVAMMNGEGARLIEEAQCGLSVVAGDSEGLADMIQQLYCMDKSDLNKLGENGFKYCMDHFGFTKCMDHLCEILNEYKDGNKRN